MFSFFHPKPVTDGRAVAVKVVQHQASARQDTRTLVVTTRSAVSANGTAHEAGPEKTPYRAGSRE